MNLKLRFLLLIIGTFVIPNLLLMIIVWLSFGSVENMKSTHDQFNMYYHLYEYLSRDVDRDLLSEFIAQLPNDMDARVFNLKELTNSTVFTDFMQTEIKKENRITLEVMAVFYVDGTEGIVIINRPSMDKYSAFRNKPLPFIFAFILFSVITILSLILIRSINLSLKKIEEATRKVAEGDFDFELKTDGTDSIATLARSFDTMRRKVKEEYDRRSRFFMGVSHDLKTPLTSIGGYADAVLEGYAEDRETLNKYMVIIKSKTSLLSNRISHLIHFVKMETRDWKETFEPVLFRSFFLDLLISFKLEASIYHHTFEYKLDIPKNITIIMDRELVARSFENILHNAYRYSYPESMVSLDASVKNSKIIITLINRGDGIARNDLPKIFEPFYRGSKGRNEDGFGLGLANVAAVIKSHGWEIYADSELKKETIFTITIPIVDV